MKLELKLRVVALFRKGWESWNILLKTKKKQQLCPNILEKNYI